VNKEQAEKCRDLGAAALRQGDFPRATKMLSKSLSLFPLPGVAALLEHAQSKVAAAAAAASSNKDSHTSTQQNQQQQQQQRTSFSSQNAARTSSTENSSSATTTNTTNGTDGRAYTAEQVRVVKKVLNAKSSSGRGAHYRVLEITESATEADIKRAYRKLSLKVHPDKVTYVCAKRSCVM
jgi:DnaJ homolog subfamily B member 12